MKRAKEILNEMEFKNWKELREYIIRTLSEKYGEGSLYHDIEKFKGTNDKLNYYIKSEIIFYLNVYRKECVINRRYVAPNNYAASLVEYTLKDEIRKIKDKLSDIDIYPAVATFLDEIQEAYECYQFLEYLSEVEGGENNEK